jgi:tRNA(Ser,Leu) C12 N-acetylase TAN1
MRRHKAGDCIELQAPKAVMTTKFKEVLVVEVDGEWELTVLLDSKQQHHVQTLGQTEDSLLRKRKSRPTNNQRLLQVDL